MNKKLIQIIKEWKDEAKVKGIIQISAFPTYRKTLTICTDRPGPMIGKGGYLLDKYTKIIQEEFSDIKEIKFIETHNWWIK